MKTWNKNICFTNKITLMILGILLFSTLVLAGGWPNSIKEKTINKMDEQTWIPTQEDIRYQDSMYQIIQQTQLEVDTIKVAIDDIIYKLEKLEYADGTRDSIRVKQ